jgi:hypothetical protein
MKDSKDSNSTTKTNGDEASITKTPASLPAAEPWDSGELGRDESFAECAPPELQQEIDKALELQMISIRLQKVSLKDLKWIAEYRGLGYQPLIRDVLAQWVRAELSLIVRELQEQKRVQAELAEYAAQKAADELAKQADKKRACG